MLGLTCPAGVGWSVGGPWLMNFNASTGRGLLFSITHGTFETPHPAPQPPTRGLLGSNFDDEMAIDYYWTRYVGAFTRFTRNDPSNERWTSTLRSFTGYVPRAGLGRLRPPDRPQPAGTVKLWTCLRLSSDQLKGDHYTVSYPVSPAGHCAGTVVRLEGFAYSAAGPGRLPLYPCYWPRVGDPPFSDIFLSNRADCEGATPNGPVLGYTSA
jgi:hypothetical protein